jgi:hypothetical protein
MDDGTIANAASTYLGISFAVLACLCMLGLTAILVLNQYKKINATKDRFGAVIDGLNPRSMVGRFWSPITLLRWIVTIVIMVSLRDYSALQILLLLQISVAFQITLLRSKPHREPLDRRMSLFNELMVSLYLYILSTLTDFNAIQEDTHTSWALLSIVLASLSVNLGKALYLLSAEGYRRYRRCNAPQP